MTNNPSERAQPTGRLRIAMVVPPWYELPPPGYGGLEQVCSALIDALVTKGHEVTLFGAGKGTGTAAHFVGTVPELQHHRLGQALPELAHLSRVNRMISRESFDIVHDHTTVGPYAAAERDVPTLTTVHGMPTGELGEVLGDSAPRVGLVAISHTQRRLAPELAWAATIHNGISTANLVTKSAPGMGPVLWLARFSADKGPDLAIEACRAAGLPLVLAGKCDSRAERQYLEQVIEPMVGSDVTVLRNPDRDATVRLMLAARALIMPIRWEEPFGMVMVEAMATGTPVVALNRGAVPELIRHGETGLICDDPADLAPALLDAVRLDPGACVAHVRREFSAARMADDYERAYRAWAEPTPAQPVEHPSAPSVAW
ncbi:glycosyltransferase family 4 protein [Plantactinospora solaniradicis]|uniref:Glycosyltransferase family 4 protein n=1 Tax=Plantactinospora solaniradicis TaxID=1723736 RepID=A0ABW1JZN5_9ACTN